MYTKSIPKSKSKKYLTQNQSSVKNKRREEIKLRNKLTTAKVMVMVKKQKGSPLLKFLRLRMGKIFPLNPKDKTRRTVDEAIYLYNSYV